MPTSRSSQPAKAHLIVSDDARLAINNCVASQKNARWLLTALALISSVPFSLIHFANAATVLPANVKSTCAFSAAEFNGIFESGSISRNGGVLPADHSDATGNMLGTSPGADGFSGGLSHIWAPILPLFP